jgi:cell wall-associated NlpC family hydrolase
VRLRSKLAILALFFCALSLHRLSAQQQIQEPKISITQQPAKDPSRNQAPAVLRTLTPDDGLAVIAAALDSRFHLHAKMDCSHLVHEIYDRAGFAYTYSRSSDLYAGVGEFQRVENPQPGDLVVWRGHVGIVINPALHVFFSAMRAGPEIDTYDAPYWKRRGHVRFYRYIKGSAAQNRKDHFVLAHQDG